MDRSRTPFVSGVITNNPLAAGGTTLNSVALANLPVISAPNIAALILDPAAAGGAPEVVHVTAHTASAQTATILRAQEGTAARAHNINTPFVHAPTIFDFGYTKGSDLASASTITLPATSEDYFLVTGTTTTNSISAREGGRRVILKFNSVLTIVHGANLNLAGATNITTVAGQVVEFVSEDSGVWRQVGGSGLSATPGGELGGTWASPTVDATHSGSQHHLHVFDEETNDGLQTSLPSNNSVVDVSGGGITCSAGTWLLIFSGYGLNVGSSALADITLIIRNTSNTVIASISFTVGPNGEQGNGTVFAIVTPVSTTGYKPSAQQGSGLASIYAGGEMIGIRLHD